MKARTSRRRLLLAPAAYLLTRPFVEFHAARAQEMRAPRIFILMHKNQGLYANNKTETFIPQKVQGQLVFPTALGSLRGYERYVTVLGGVEVRNWVGYDWHHSAAGQYSGSKFSVAANLEKATERGKPTGESVDQAIARAWNCPVRVTDFGRHPKRRAHKPAHFVSWRKQGTEVSAQSPANGVEETFALLFGKFAGTGASPPDVIARRGKSLLDAYLTDVKQLKTALPADVGANLDGHLEGFRSFERELFAPAATSSCAAKDVDPAWKQGNPVWSHDDILKRATLYAQMIRFSAACGLDRVFIYGCVDDDDSGIRPEHWDPRFVMGENIRDVDATGERKYHNDLWHSAPRLSHHEELEAFLFERSFGYVIKLLAETKLTSSTSLLDEALLLYGGSQSFNHSNAAQPYLFVGGAAGRHRGNQVLLFGDRFGRPNDRISNNHVLASTCQLAGVPVDRFGDPEFGTGAVPGL
jgi:hypothetical protein